MYNGWTEVSAQEDYGCQNISHKKEREAKNEMDGSGCGGYECDGC